MKNHYNYMYFYEIYNFQFLRKTKTVINEYLLTVLVSGTEEYNFPDDILLLLFRGCRQHFSELHQHE